MSAQLKLETLADEMMLGSPVEQRATRRKRVLLAAKVAFGMTMADCTIRDLSEGGARIHAPTVLGLPNEVDLLIMREGLVVRAKRIWAGFPHFGLKFLAAEGVEKSTRPQAAFLRGAWEDWLRSQHS
jgi:hypothetical protein